MEPYRLLQLKSESKFLENFCEFLTLRGKECLAIELLAYILFKESNVSTSERMKELVRIRRENGLPIGRPKTRPSYEIKRLRNLGKTYREIGKILGCSKSSVAMELKKITSL